MSGHLKAFITILILGIVGIVGYRFLMPIWLDQTQRQASDAVSEHGTVAVGVDNWVGNFPLCSPEMAKRMRSAGFNFRCENDNADYRKRFTRLTDGELQFAVASVDAYVLDGYRRQYSGAIVAVLDQSKGGDAIVARRAVIGNLDALKKAPTIRIAFSPDSPSEHLLKNVGVHFDVPHLTDRKGTWRITANGSSDALAKLQRGQSDVAVLREPDVSRALANDEFIKLIGSEDVDNVIVDVLIASSAMIQEKPDVVATVLDQYFQTLKQYREEPTLLREQLRSYAKVDSSQVDTLLKGVAWTSLSDNGIQWLGVTSASAGGEQQLADTINATAQILVSAGDFDRNPLPDRDPNRLTNGQFIAKIFRGANVDGKSDSIKRKFTQLDEDGWLRLQEVGTLKIEPLIFQRGTASLADADVQVLARTVERLRHYPNYRILVKGHTGAGDPDANMELSKLRAQAVAAHLLSTFDIDSNRIRAVGFGSSQPLARQDGESDRAYRYRLPRVEIVLMSESN